MSARAASTGYDCHRGGKHKQFDSFVPQIDERYIQNGVLETGGLDGVSGAGCGDRRTWKYVHLWPSHRS